MDMSMSDWVFDVIPIFMIRLVADTGGIMTGGAAQVGSVGTTVASRSWTSSRSVTRSVPSLKISSIDESWETDFDRMTSSLGTPLSTCSRGTVMRPSTSDAVRPTARVWISTRGGANSGKTSTGVWNSLATPKNRSPPAAATSRKRNLRLERTIQRIMAQVAFHSLFELGDLDTQQLGRPDGHHRRSDRGPCRENRLIAGDGVDGDGLLHVGERPRARVREGGAVVVVLDGCDGDHQPASRRGLHRSRLDAEALGCPLRQPYPLVPRPCEEDLVNLGGRLRSGLRRFGARRERQATHQYHRNDPSPSCPHQSSSCAHESVGPTIAQLAPVTSVAPVGALIADPAVLPS